MLATLVVLIATGFPVAFTLMGTAVGFALLGNALGFFDAHWLTALALPRARPHERRPAAGGPGLHLSRRDPAAHHAFHRPAGDHGGALRGTRGRPRHLEHRARGSARADHRRRRRHGAHDRIAHAPQHARRRLRPPLRERHRLLRRHARHHHPAVDHPHHAFGPDAARGARYGGAGRRLGQRELPADLPRARCCPWRSCSAPTSPTRSALRCSRRGRARASPPQQRPRLTLAARGREPRPAARD